jgi:hypothetical protein
MWDTHSIVGDSWADTHGSAEVLKVGVWREEIPGAATGVNDPSDGRKEVSFTVLSSLRRAMAEGLTSGAV